MVAGVLSFYARRSYAHAAQAEADLHRLETCFTI
jgi:hypothetical protein